MTFDFVAGLHAYDHGGPSWCVLSKDYFCCRQFVLFCCFSLFFLSRLCQCKLLLASPFLLFFFSRHEDVASLFMDRGVCNDRGLGPGSEAGPRLDKRGSPRGVL